MASKNVIIKRKIANEIFELLPKTSGAQVEVTYGAEVKNLAEVLSTVYTDLNAWNTFKADVDFAGADSALDTLRELIDYLSGQDVATSIANQLADIKERLTAVEAKADKNTEDIAALQQTVANNKSAADTGIQEAKDAAAVADGKAVKNAEDIAALQQTVAANKTAAEEAVAEVQGQIDTIKDIQGAQARVIVAEEIPEDLTENDLMMQIIA